MFPLNVSFVCGNYFTFSSTIGVLLEDTNCNKIIILFICGNYMSVSNSTSPPSPGIIDTGRSISQFLFKIMKRHLLKLRSVQLK